MARKLSQLSFVHDWEEKVKTFESFHLRILPLSRPVPVLLLTGKRQEGRLAGTRWRGMCRQAPALTESFIYVNKTYINLTQPSFRRQFSLRIARAALKVNSGHAEKYKLLFELATDEPSVRGHITSQRCLGPGWSTTCISFKS